MKYYCIALLLLFSVEVNAQESITASEVKTEDSLADKLRKNFTPVNWEDIEFEVTDRYVDTYYPYMYVRYMEGDETLDLNDYRLLYYGYSFQNTYDPLATSLLQKEAMVYHNQISRTLTRDELLELVEKTKRALDQNPFNLILLNLLSFSYLKLGDEVNTQISARKMDGVIEAILSSGSGVDKTSPWSVIYRADIVDLTAALGGNYSMRMYITTDVEYFHLKDRIEGVRGFYFDLSAIMRKAHRTEKGFRGIDFDPMSYMGK